jgi:predicted dinucleotide-binding enzyme
MKKTIGFIGAGQIGKALARHLADAGYPILLSNSRGRHSLEELAQQLGKNVKAVDVAGASVADIIVLTVPWSKLKAAVMDIKDWNNKIVIDTTNNILSVSPSLELANLNGQTTGEVVAGLLPDARVVKAFNTLNFKILDMSPSETIGNRVIFLSGDDQEAKSTVAEIIATVGFVPVDLGSLKDGGKLQDVGGVLSGIDLVKKSKNA